MPAFKYRLRPYQVDGYQWLCFLAEHGMGGILADDMGLGKTLQTLAFMTRAREAAKGAPFLVVAPTSVASNWVSEARKFTPHLDVRLLDVTARRREGDLADAVRGADVVVTSYAIVRIDGEEFREKEWDAVRAARQDGGSAGSGTGAGRRDLPGASSGSPPHHLCCEMTGVSSQARRLGIMGPVPGGGHLLTPCRVAGSRRGGRAQPSPERGQQTT